MKAKYIKSDAVKVLEDMAFKANKEKYPNFPYPVKVKYRDDTANGLTRCIIDYLHFNGCQAERINTTGRPIDERRIVSDVAGHQRQIGSIRWIRGAGTNGSADISATIHGLSVKIEVKIGRDSQSDAQRRYQSDIERAGGIYYIAKNFADFAKWYKSKFFSNG